MALASKTRRHLCLIKARFRCTTPTKWVADKLDFENAHCHLLFDFESSPEYPLIVFSHPGWASSALVGKKVVLRELPRAAGPMTAGKEDPLVPPVNPTTSAQNEMLIGALREAPPRFLSNTGEEPHGVRTGRRTESQTQWRRPFRPYPAGGIFIMAAPH